MSTPVITFRVSADQQAAVREIVNATKSNPGLTASVQKFIHQASQGPTATDSIGPFLNAEAALSVLVTNLSVAFNPDAIFLFGSRASGTARPDSDFNLMVVTPSKHSLDYLSARKPVAGCGVPVDVVPCRYPTFMKHRKTPGMLPFIVDQEGRLLHARAGGPFWKRYCDLFPEKWIPRLF